MLEGEKLGARVLDGLDRIKRLKESWKMYTFHSFSTTFLSIGSV